MIAESFILTTLVYGIELFLVVVAVISLFVAIMAYKDGIWPYAGRCAILGTTAALIAVLIDIFMC